MLTLGVIYYITIIYYILYIIYYIIILYYYYIILYYTLLPNPPLPSICSSSSSSLISSCSFLFHSLPPSQSIYLSLPSLPIFILYVSAFGYPYLYSRLIQLLTPHVLSEWMVEVCGAYLYPVLDSGFWLLTFELLKGIGEDLSSWMVDVRCSVIILFLLLYIIYYTYTYTIILYIIYYIYYTILIIIISYTILFSSSSSFPFPSIFCSILPFSSSSLLPILFSSLPLPSSFPPIYLQFCFPPSLSLSSIIPPPLPSQPISFILYVSVLRYTYLYIILYPNLLYCSR